MKFIINIGTERSQALLLEDFLDDGIKSSLVLWREARAALRAVGFKINRCHFVPPNDDEEGTHVAELDVSRIPPGEVYIRLHSVAAALHQDCIAVVPVDDYFNPGYRLPGHLIGPRADKWGEFNPEYFKDPLA